MKTLLKIHFTQLRRSRNKMAFFGKAYLYIVWWVMAVALLSTTLTPDMRSTISRYAPLVAIILPLCTIIPDLIQKFIFKRDETAMDAFLKTRPIEQRTWDRFLRLSQLWHEDNLFMPGVCLPILFVLPVGWALLCLLLVYIVSVVDGLIVMESKRGNGYAEDGAITHQRKAIGAKTIYNSIFDLQIKSLIRSRRLISQVIVVPLIFVVYIPFIINEKAMGNFPLFFLPLVLAIPSMTLGQFGMGVEANFFSAIATRPVSIQRILMDKYKLFAMMTFVYMLILLIACLFVGLPIYRLLAYAIFTAGLGNMLILIDAYRCSPFDLFGKVFFNHQGSKAAYKLSVFAAMFSGPLLTVGLVHLCGDMTGHGILAALGVAGFLTARPYFRWVEKRFMNNRYKYMEKYNS